MTKFDLFLQDSHVVLYLHSSYMQYRIYFNTICNIFKNLYNCTVDIIVSDLLPFILTISINGIEIN